MSKWDHFWSFSKDHVPSFCTERIKPKAKCDIFFSITKKKQVWKKAGSNCYLDSFCGFILTSPNIFVHSSLKIDYVWLEAICDILLLKFSFCKTCWISALKMRDNYLYNALLPYCCCYEFWNNAKVANLIWVICPGFEERSQKQCKNGRRKTVTFSTCFLQCTLSKYKFNSFLTILEK